MARRSDQTDFSIQILDAALELFSKHGYDGVKTSEIAVLAGTSRPSIHYHFKNKKELWEATMQVLTKRIESNTHFLTLIDSGLEGLEGLKTFYSALIKVHAEIPELGRIMFLEGVSGSDRLDWIGGTLFKTSNDVVLRLVGECIEAGIFKPYSPEKIRMLMDGAAVTYFNLSPYVFSLYESEPHHQKNVEEFEALFMDSIFAGLLV